MATHSNTLAWKIPWIEEPGRLQSMGSRRVGHYWATSLSLFTFMHWWRKWQPTPVFLPGESQGRGSLVGCRLWGHTESDTTEAIYYHHQQQQFTIWCFYHLAFAHALSCSQNNSSPPPRPTHPTPNFSIVTSYWRLMSTHVCRLNLNITTPGNLVLSYLTAPEESELSSSVPMRPVLLFGTVSEHRIEMLL